MYLTCKISEQKQVHQITPMHASIMTFPFTKFAFFNPFSLSIQTPIKSKSDHIHRQSALTAPPFLRRIRIHNLPLIPYSPSPPSPNSLHNAPTRREKNDSVPKPLQREYKRTHNVKHIVRFPGVSESLSAIDGGGNPGNEDGDCEEEGGFGVCPF